MASKADLSKIVSVISWLEGYVGHDFKDPAKIDEAVKSADLEYLSRGWKSVREDVEMIYAQQGRLSRTSGILKRISDSVMYVYFGTYVIAMLFKIQILMMLIFNPLFLIAVLAVTFLYPIVRYKTIKEIREKSGTYAKKLQKVKGVIQDLIFYLCEKIRIQEKDPKKFKIQISDPDYQGITVVGRPGLLASEYYTAVPSVIGAIVSKEKHYIKVVDPWATEKEAFEVLFKVNSKVKIKALIPDEIGKNKRFQKTWKTVEEKTAGNISLLSCDLNNLNNRVVITRKNAWRAEKKEWHTLVQVRDRKEKEALEKAFDEKWAKAHPI